MFRLVYDPKHAQMLKGIGECEIELAKLANTKRRIAQMSDDFGMWTVILAFHSQSYSSSYTLIHARYLSSRFLRANSHQRLCALHEAFVCSCDYPMWA
jgi:hypothetical protein